LAILFNSMCWYTKNKKIKYMPDLVKGYIQSTKICARKIIKLITTPFTFKADTFEFSRNSRVLYLVMSSFFQRHPLKNTELFS
jgi:hypothetical protein